MSEDIRFHIIQHAAVRIAMSHAMSHGVIVVVSEGCLLFADVESMSQLGLSGCTGREH